MSKSESGSLQCEGFELRYVVEGQGLPAIVIGSSLYYPKSFSQNLRNHLRMAFVDWRGFAKTTPASCDSQMHFDTLLEDIELIRQKIGYDRCIIIGHSAHALMALEYAKRYPDKVSHVVMIGISPNLSADMATMAQCHWEQSAGRERKKAFEMRLKEFSDAELDKLSPSERFVAWYVRRDPQAWYDYQFNSSFLWEGVLPHMPSFDFLYGVVLRDLDIAKNLESFALPVFLGLGRYDYIIAPTSAWDTYRPHFRDLTMRVFEHSGHSPQYEEAALFDSELLGWLTQRPIKKTKHIVVVPYQTDWPQLYAQEAAKIKEALGDNCIAVHHIGSTSVPGLSAKPVIDMIAVIKNPDTAVAPLENLGFQYKGEYNIPMRLYFNRSTGIDTNLHVYQENHPEIDLNLLFRDYLRQHPEARDEYAKLKATLLQDKSSYEKNKSVFTGYNLGKDAFIRKILQAAGFNRLRMMKCTHYAEWDAVKLMRNKYFFDPLSISDPYTWTFDHPEHAHLVLYYGVDIIGYAHVQFWPHQRAALRIIVVDEKYRNHGFGSAFLKLIEQWLHKLGTKSLHDEARVSALNFYRKNGYTEMPFEDPSGEPPSLHDIALGKILS